MKDIIKITIKYSSIIIDVYIYNRLLYFGIFCIYNSLHVFITLFFIYSVMIKGYQSKPG